MHPFYTVQATPLALKIPPEILSEHSVSLGKESGLGLVAVSSDIPLEQAKAN